MSGLSSIVTNPYLILLLICHLLSDYYFQSQKMADRKDQDKKVLGLHILYVALPLFIVSLCHLDLWWICLVILLTHAGIDFLKPIVQKQLKLPPITRYQFPGAILQTIRMALKSHPIIYIIMYTRARNIRLTSPMHATWLPHES